MPSTIAWFGDRGLVLVEQADLQRARRQRCVRLRLRPRWRRARTRADPCRAGAARRPPARPPPAGAAATGDAGDQHRAQAARAGIVNVSALQALAVDGDLGGELVAGRHAFEQHAAAVVGLEGAAARIAARVLDDGADLDVRDRVRRHLAGDAHADGAGRHPAIGQRPPDDLRQVRHLAACRPAPIIGCAPAAGAASSAAARSSRSRAFRRMICRTSRPDRFRSGRPRTWAARRPARARTPRRGRLPSRLSSAAVAPEGSTTGSSSRSFSSFSIRPAVVASRVQLRDQAHRPIAVAFDHLAVVALGDLAHLVVELDLLDRLQHQLLLAFQLAHEAAALTGGAARRRPLDAGQRIDHPPQRARGERQRHPAQREHHQRRPEAHALDRRTRRRGRRRRRSRPTSTSASGAGAPSLSTRPSTGRHSVKVAELVIELVGKLRVGDGLFGGVGRRAAARLARRYAP